MYLAHFILHLCHLPAESKPLIATCSRLARWLEVGWQKWCHHETYWSRCGTKLSPDARTTRFLAPTQSPPLCTFVVLSYDPPGIFGGCGTSSHQLVDPEQSFLPGPNPSSAALCLPSSDFRLFFPSLPLLFATHVPLCNYPVLSYDPPHMAQVPPGQVFPTLSSAKICAPIAPVLSVSHS